MPPTKVRHAVLAATTLTAFLMYLDRICMAWIVDSASFDADFKLAPEQKQLQKDLLKSAFFWAYALAQVPAGWLAERYGKRRLMTVLILLWSLFTALTGFAESLWMLLLARIGCGMAEAGAYPISGSLLNRWSHVDWRGFATSIVSTGGRLGAVFAPAITVAVIVSFGNWRWAGWAYGMLGILVAGFFWKVFRETPAEHPGCNQAERDLLAQGRAPVAAGAAKAPFPWRHVLTSRSLWLMCAFQFLTNYGWAFVINSMSTYLKEVRHLTDTQNGRVSTLALGIGLAGLLLGGLATDYASRRWGADRGRRVILISTRFLAAAMFLLCLRAQSVWQITLCLGLMTFFTDAALPAVWTWMQDAGGDHIAPIFGWGNLWGNFGAAIQPLANGWIVSRFDANKDWSESFVVSAAAFIMAGVIAFYLVPPKPATQTPAQS